MDWRSFILMFCLHSWSWLAWFWPGLGWTGLASSGMTKSMFGNLQNKSLVFWVDQLIGVVVIVVVGHQKTNMNFFEQKRFHTENAARYEC